METLGINRINEGAEVKQWQSCINQLGFYHHAIDGLFGSLTEAATKQFQQHYHLSVDGLVGTQTWNKGLEVLEEKLDGTTEETLSILVKRQPSNADGTLSTFYFNGVEMGKGVEDVQREIKVHGKTCIPDGKYNVSMRNSPKFSSSYYVSKDGELIKASDRTTAELKEKYPDQHELVWVKDVPDYSYILWHWGNTALDTEGCYVVGTNFATVNGLKGVGASRSKYVDIYPTLWKAIKNGKVTVEYRTES